ncbi:unnamed protein product, partial [Porites lobata]
QYKERSYYYYYHLPVLEAHVQQQFFVHFFKPHFATEQRPVLMDEFVEWYQLKHPPQSSSAWKKLLCQRNVIEWLNIKMAKFTSY